VKTKNNIILTLIACCILLYSCTEADILYPGFVQIHPNRSIHALSKIEYHFYNEKTCLVHESDNEGNFEGQLRPGAYQVLATNTDAAGATFSEMDSYDKATVAIANGQTRSSFANTLSPVYSVVLEELEVPDRKSVLMEPSPTSLTKQLVLVFFLQDGLDTEIASISGDLFGVYPSVYLATGLPSEESFEESPVTSVHFSVAGEGVQREAQIGLLGLRDPGAEPTYTNDLSLTLTLYNGKEKETIIPMTSTLSSIIDGNDGKLPVHVFFVIELTKQVDDIKGGIKAWTDGTEETITVGGS
jgi:hypothetical protein